ncbi:MAG: FliM/FliN family flagellar motor switch protein [Pseudomonadota bacterium]
MSDPVISDEEKDALLDGVESGEVPVQMDGESASASVKDFEFSPRSRIVSNSFPRLTVLNEQLSIRASQVFEGLLGTEVSMQSTGIDVLPFSETGDHSQVALMEFALPPLEGPALLLLGAGFLGQLVEAFFGGSTENPPHVGEDGFTAGELKVAALFSRELLGALADAWQSLDNFEPELKGVLQPSDMLELIDASEDVLVCNFDIEFLGEPQYFRIVWPKATLAPVIPALEGQRRDRDPAEDARWNHTLRSSVTDSIVQVSSHIGRAKLSLREIVDLKPGDVIEIDDPRSGKLLAADVAVVKGRFGVHDGRYAMEAQSWLTGKTPA